MKPPATNFAERVLPNEESDFKQFADALVEAQKRLSLRFGKGRALHRKGHATLAASLEVLGGLPAHAAHGVFAKPATYDALIRLSNGSAFVQKDKEPDIRGFALKVRGLPESDSALGARTTEQDFVMINREVFGFATAEPFFGIVLAGARGPLALVGHLIKTHGLFKGLAEVKRLLGSFSRKFSGFLTADFFTAAPIQCGPYAMRLRLVPRVKNDAHRPAAALIDDVRADLKNAPLVFDLEAQFFVDEATTPIEDGTVDWPASEAPFVKVAVLTIPSQQLDDATGTSRSQAGESAKFDPWNALAAHRPLGHIMRARKAAYFPSQQARA